MMLLCGLCFGLGYFFGHHGSVPAVVAADKSERDLAHTKNWMPKPSASTQAVNDSQPQDGEQTQAETEANAPQSETAPGTAQVRVWPASAAGTQQSPSSFSIHPAPQSGQFNVQVAAIAGQEDADVLADALRKRGYTVNENREPADGLIHVRVGPFSNREIADQWRQRLQSIGYNAIVQQ